MNEDTRQKMVFLLSMRSSALAIVAEADWSFSSSCCSFCVKEGTFFFTGADSGLIGGSTFDGGGVDIGTTLVDDMVSTAEVVVLLPRHDFAHDTGHDTGGSGAERRGGS